MSVASSVTDVLSTTSVCQPAVDSGINDEQQLRLCTDSSPRRLRYDIKIWSFHGFCSGNVSGVHTVCASLHACRCSCSAVLPATMVRDSSRNKGFALSRCLINHGLPSLSGHLTLLELDTVLLSEQQHPWEGKLLKASALPRA